MNDVTRILSAIDGGDPHAAAQLLPLVYDELRKLAAARLAQEQPGQTLQATALVHEAYVRLVQGERRGVSPTCESPVADSHVGLTPRRSPEFANRAHFFAAAAEAMRRILVEQARRRRAAKRGGAAAREDLQESAIAAPEPTVDMLALNDALDRLAKIDPPAADLVKLRFFAGLTATEAAAAMGLSVRSAHDLWSYARSWLRREMGPD